MCPELVLGDKKRSETVFFSYRREDQIIADVVAAAEMIVKVEATARQVIRNVVPERGLHRQGSGKRRRLLPVHSCVRHNAPCETQLLLQLFPCLPELVLAK